MRISRIYQNIFLKENLTVDLNREAFLHLIQVLKMKPTEKIIIFNGEGGEYLAEIISIEKNSVKIKIEKFISKSVESPIKIHLVQAVSRGEKMDFTIQKAVELGVAEITPMVTERCGVKLAKERWNKKIEHWEKIIISSCEQSGRNIIPKLNPIKNFFEIVTEAKEKNKIILDPESNNKVSKIKVEKNSTIILVGPEGGFSEKEITLANQNKFNSIKIGPRILRTETAGMVVIAIMQEKNGDY